MGKVLNSSPKASFRKGAEGVTIYASACGGIVVEGGGKDEGLKGGWASSKT